MESKTYFIANGKWHEEILGQLEDSIYNNPEMTSQQQDDLVTLLYLEFHHADTDSIAKRISLPKSLKPLSKRTN